MNKINREIKEILGLEPSAGEREILEGMVSVLGLEEIPAEEEIKRELEKKTTETKEQIKTASAADRPQLEEEYEFWKKCLEWFAGRSLDFSIPETPEPETGKADKNRFCIKDTAVPQPQKNIKPQKIDSAGNKYITGGAVMPEPPRRSRVSAALKKQADGLCEKICSYDKETALDSLKKLSEMVSRKDIFPEEFEEYCNDIEKNAARSAIKKEAWYTAGEIRRNRGEAGKALENYEKALSIEGTRHYSASYRMAHMFAFREIQTGKSAAEILSLYYDAQKDPDISFPSAWLEAANICFESKEINDTIKAIGQIEHYLNVSKGISSEDKRRQDAENILEKLKILKKAERPDSSAGDKYEAALFYVYLAERKENNFLFCRSRAEYFKKTVEWMDSAAAAASGAVRDNYLKKKELYSRVMKILDAGIFGGKEENELGELYFGLGSIDEAIKHMETAASADYPESASRLKFFRIYKKGIPEKALPEDIEQLADEYISQKNFEQAEKQLLRIKNTRQAKEKLFGIYYKKNLDFSKAEKTVEELASADSRSGNKNLNYREMYVRLLCLNGKAEKAVEPCRELLKCGSVPAMYAYACMCENKIKGSEPDKALEYYKKAAEMKHPAAMFRVFKIQSAALESGKNTFEENIKDDLVDYLNGAAKGGNADALYQRAVYEINGFEPLHFEKNLSRGIQDLETAAAAGHAPAAAQLMKQYIKEEKIEKAVEILEKFSRIVRNPDERELIPEVSGLRTTIGQAMPEDKDFSLILQSFGEGTTENGRQPAVLFSELLLKGSEKIKQNVPLALKLLHHLSDNRNNFSREAAALLGEVYYLGIHAEKIKADERPFQREEYISKSDPVERDLEKALFYLEKCEDDWSRYYTARIYMNKKDCSAADLEKAVNLFEKSGLPAAKYYLGRLHEQGRGVTQLPSKAREYYEAASAKGFAAAYFRYAELLRKADLDDDALEYYMKAVINGSNEALETLSEIMRKENYSARKILKLIDKMKKEFSDFISSSGNNLNDTLLCMGALLAEKENRDEEAEQFRKKITDPYWKKKCR
jgi:TPR repeat protein